MTAHLPPGSPAAGVPATAPPATAPPAIDDRVIDLDQSRAARAEARGTAPVLRFLGTDYTLPPMLAAEALETISNLEDVRQAARVLEWCFNEGDYERVKAAARAAGWPLDLEDLTFLLEKIFGAYGLNLGE